MSDRHDEGGHSAFRQVPRTGVIYVTTEAVKRGFRPSDPTWCNLGQGQPETGPLEGAPARVHEVTVSVDDLEYAPVAGLWDGNRLSFSTPEYGVAPGQSAVFYDGERVLGGGTIVATEAAEMDETVAA